MFASNTSTLVLLAKIRCLEEFIKISPIIEVPSQVKEEALFHKESDYAMLIKKLIDEKKVRVLSINNKEIAEIIEQFHLDLGEAATYAMFDKKRHKAILTDDGELIKLCRLEKIPFICAIAIIIRLYEKQKLSKDDAFEKLKKLNEIGRYSKDLYDYFKEEIK